MEAAIFIIFFSMLIVSIILVVYSTYHYDVKIHNTALIFTIVFAASIGVMIPQNIMHTKKIVTPKINITCIDNKCDTTYIYNFKNK
jgi:hypothetical protein